MNDPLNQPVNLVIAERSAPSPSPGGPSAIPGTEKSGSGKPRNEKPSAGHPIAAQAVGAIKVYGSGPTALHALRHIDVHFDQGQLTAVMGPSGSGKSTLLHCMAGLDRLTEGTARIGGTDLASLTDTKLTELRRDQVGFVFQSFNLVPNLSAAENIALPSTLAGRPVDTDWFDQLVTSTGLAERLAHRPNELSGGQQQRVAVARAMVNRPEIIFGDEPTGNLDSATSTDILGLLRAAVADHGQTVVIVTHDPAAAAYADRVLLLADGRVAGDLGAPTPELVLDHVTQLDNGIAGERSTRHEGGRR